MSRIHPVIMAGGRGTRFWPASREALPKQFLAIDGDRSLLRRTGERVLPLSGPQEVWVVTNAAHVGVVADHLPEIPRDQIVGEPEGRNTAPCAALAAALVAREDPEGVILLCPADHWIGDEEAFREACRAGCDLARETRGLVTFGVVPTSPDTGYGYIEAGEPEGERARRVVRFTEKPDRATAERFLAGGRHYWNSGIFAWRADAFLEELAAVRPEMVETSRRIAAATDRESALAGLWKDYESISVDYAVLEPSERVWVVPVDFPWSDVGSWDALADVLPGDADGNALAGDVVVVDSRRCLVRGGADRLVALVGLEDVLVIDTPDALLVCSRDRAQDVRDAVAALERDGRRDLL